MRLPMCSTFVSCRLGSRGVDIHVTDGGSDCFLTPSWKELQRFDYRRGCLVGNLASEITNATPALKKRVAEQLDEATRHVSVVIEQGQRAGDIQADIPPMDLARFLLNSLYGAIVRSRPRRPNAP